MAGNIASHISSMRNILNKFGEDTTPYSDQFLYHLFATAASRLMGQRYGTNRKISNWNTGYFCIALERGTVHNCDCLPSCDILKTKYDIPKPIPAKGGDMIKVFTLDHREISYIDPQVAYTLQYDEVRKNKMHWSMVDKRIVLWNADTKYVTPKAILISGYWEDPSEWTNVQYCDENGDDQGVCFNIRTTEFPLDADLTLTAYEMALNPLKVTLNVPNDRVNEGKDVLQQ